MNHRRKSKLMSRRLDVSSSKVDFDQFNPELRRTRALMKEIKLPIVLAELMKRTKITPRALAKETGVPASTIASYTASKKKTYNPEHLASLASYFEISADYLLFGGTEGSGNPFELPLEEVFQGWLKVRVERAVPVKKKDGSK